MILSEVALIVDGSVYGKKHFVVENVLPPDDAKRSELTFLFDPKQETKAGAVIALKKIRGKNGIIVKNTRKALYMLLKKLSKQKRQKGVSTNASIGNKVKIPKSCTVEPFTVIKDNVKLGKNTYIGSHCYIDEDVVIGENCDINPNTTIFRNTKIGNYVIVNSNTVIGKEGFGYIKKKRYERLRHIGGVLIKDFVEIGGNVTIDKGTIGNTVVGEGTKIDNLVHIAHNVKIGRDCIIMGQNGIAGSTTIGNNVTLCGQVGISDHLKIGDNVIIYAKSGVFKSVAKDKRYSGIPAREHAAVLRAISRLYRKS